MAASAVHIDGFVALAAAHPVLDVRSPGEYRHAHIPGAVSLPLFTDEERKVVGTAYKQQSRQAAIKAGLDYFGVKMRLMVEQAEAICRSQGGGNTVLLHCWRGGMRSAGVAWLLDLYGFKVFTLAGGYKAFRQWALQQFAKPYRLIALSGGTGTGKTDVLHELRLGGHTVIDLEGIAGHRGSAFGALGLPPQPSQEQFENVLAIALHGASHKCGPLWIEDESQRIGLVNLPNDFWNTMRMAPIYYLDVPFEERLDYITAGYGHFSADELKAAIGRIQKRLGSLAAKNAIGHLLADNCKESFRILLTYYDKQYGKCMACRQPPALTIPCATTDTRANAAALITCYEASL